MPNNLADCYALLDLEADHDRIARHKRALATLTGDGAGGDVPSLLSCGSLALDSMDAGDAKHAAVVAAVRAEDDGFSVIRHKFELQVVACAVLSDRLVSQASDPRAATVIAFGIVPQLALRQYPSPYRTMLQELGSKALSTLEDQARSMRSRAIPDKDRLMQKIKAPPDFDLPAASDASFPSTLSSSLAKHLGQAHGEMLAFITAVTRASEFDREELDILWWYLTGLSKRRATGYGSMTATAALVNLSGDLAHLVSLPPLTASRILLEKMISRYCGGAPHDLRLDQLAQEPIDGKLSTYEEEFPVLFPLFWLRKLAAEGKKDWQCEWEGKTHLTATVTLPSQDFAVWHYSELILRRTLA